MKNLDCNQSAKKKLSWCVKFTKEFLSVIILLEISYLLFFPFHYSKYQETNVV